ncbi:MAG: hypothetical protein ACON4U_17030 [Myxococcota bacterium]
MILFSSLSLAYVDEACRQFADTDGDGAPGPAPEGYSEQGQQDFLLNFFSLATTFSPLHAPIPQAGGTGTAGLEVAIIPPLPCSRRLVLDYTKTEDTNKTPAAPRPRVSFSMPKRDTAIGTVVPYGSFGYVPPITFAGTRNVIVSVEAGVGISPNEGGGIQYGMRYHATLMKTVAEIATPFNEGDPEALDFYVGSTFGLDAMVGYRMNKWIPYAAFGFTDVSTFFYIDDDGIVINNENPYAGSVISAGTQYRISEHLQSAAELYLAPGHIFTGRLRLSYLF